jgi:alkylation response protein AidB-like acyl-CoA dehydrogenase
MATGLVDLGEQYEQLRVSVRAFAREQVAPRAADADRAARYPQDLFEAMRDADLLGLPIPAEHGGAGAGMVGLCVAIEEVSRYCNSAGLMLLLSRLAAGPIMICGDQEQQRRYLSEIAAGALRGSFCLTEPHAGSDVAAIATTARPDGDGYLLNGRKSYISGATVADFYVVWAKTEPDAGAAGIAGFLVDRSAPGVVIGHVDEKMGVRAVPTAEVVLDGVHISAANRLTEPGRGFHELMATLNSARPGVAARGLGLAQGALKYAVDYARERRAFGSSLLDIQAVQFMVADLAMQVESARFLVYAAARLVDSGSYGIQAAPWIAMAKCVATDLAVKASSDCLQILGAAGYMADHPMERYYRDAKQLQIVEGTSQIQRLIVARAIRDGHLDLG